jgi:hypothetical protein
MDGCFAHIPYFSHRQHPLETLLEPLITLLDNKSVAFPSHLVVMVARLHLLLDISSSARAAPIACETSAAVWYLVYILRGYWAFINGRTQPCQTTFSCALNSQTVVRRSPSLRSTVYQLFGFRIYSRSLQWRLPLRPTDRAAAGSSSLVLFDFLIFQLFFIRYLFWLLALPDLLRWLYAVVLFFLFSSSSQSLFAIIFSASCSFRRIIISYLRVEMISFMTYYHPFHVARSTYLLVQTDGCYCCCC